MKILRHLLSALLLAALAACSQPKPGVQVRAQPGPGHITVTWSNAPAASRATVQRVELAANGDRLGRFEPLAAAPEGALSYRDTTVVPGSVYRYAIAFEREGGGERVVYQQGSTRAIEPLAVRRAEAIDGRTVLVVLSKPVEAPVATALAKYRIEPHLEIHSARLSEQGTEVYLTTSAQDEIEYTLYVTDMVDVTGYGLLPDSDSARFQGKKPDTDGDGLTDEAEALGWTVTFTAEPGLTLTRAVTSDPALADTDGDGLSDSEEKRVGTDPRERDTDGDGLSDRDEIHTYGTDPLHWDTDGDGLSDMEEVGGYWVGGAFVTTDPLDPDTDGDGVSDADEARGYDPGNGVFVVTDPTNPDTDGDGLPDGVDPDPTNPDVPSAYPASSARSAD